LFVFVVVFQFGLYVATTQYRSYGDISALLVEEDLRCPFMHFVRHKRAPEQNHRRSVNWKASSNLMKESKVPGEIIIAGGILAYCLSSFLSAT
jgi:hypothetical protein